MSWTDPGLLDYVSFHQATHLNYHRANIDSQDYEKLVSRAMKSVQQDLPTSVLDTSKGPKVLLELGVRYLFS